MTGLYLLLYLAPISLILLKGLPFLTEIIRDPYYQKIVLFTVKQATLSTILALLAGLPGAWIMTKNSFRGKKLINSIYKIPFVLPSILTVLGFVIFYGNNGYLNALLLNRLFKKPLKILYSFKAVLLAHVFYNFPVIVSVISSSWKNLDMSMEEAAKTDGASYFSVFFKITLPRLKSSILSACALVFLYCFSSFAIILVLGGSPDLTTAEAEIYRLGRILLDTEKASALSIISGFSACIVLFIYKKIQKSNNIQENGSIRECNFSHPVLSVLYLILSVLFVLAPVVSIIIRSCFSKPTRTSPSVFSLKAFANIPVDSIVITLLIGIISSVLSTAMAISFCKKKYKSDIAVLLPMATSSVILGLGYFTISKYLGFISPAVLTILVHSVLNTGFAYKTIEPAYSKIPQVFREQAKSDGASEKQINKQITIPIIRNSVVSSCLFCFVLSAGELNSTLLLGNGNIQTIPVAIYRMIGSYNYQGACALGTVLIIVCLILFYTVERITSLYS